MFGQKLSLENNNFKTTDEFKTKIVLKYNCINNFLSNFIGHTYSKADYIVQEKSSFESMLDFELSNIEQEVGYFYNGKFYLK